MNTEITIIASIFLLLGGLAAFPFTLDYSNNHYSKYIPVAGRTGSVSVYARLQQYFMDAPLDAP